MTPRRLHGIGEFTAIAFGVGLIVAGIGHGLGWW
jgi:hypothetical protein